MIRKARKEDADTLATCLLQAMEEIVYHFIGIKDEVKAQAFLHHLVQGEANSILTKTALLRKLKEGSLLP